MMTSNRRYRIQKSGEPVDLYADAWTMVEKLKILGINTSTSALYRMKKDESKKVPIPNSKIPKHVTITCIN